MRTLEGRVLERDLRLLEPPYKSVIVPVQQCTEGLYGTLLIAAVAFDRQSLAYRLEINKNDERAYDRLDKHIVSLTMQGLIYAGSAGTGVRGRRRQLLVGHNEKLQRKVGNGFDEAFSLTGNDQWMQYHLVNYYPPNDQRRDSQFERLVLSGDSRDRVIITYQNKEWWLVHHSPLTMQIAKERIYADEWWCYNHNRR